MAIKDKLIKNTFIHIPKCGGSTFVGLLKDSVPLSENEKKIPTHNIQLIGNIKIEHVDFSNPDRKFRRPQIFDPLKQTPFIGQQIFMIARNPLDRLFSEFNFQYHILNGKMGNPNAAIISKLKPSPSTFEDYIEFPETQNYQCKFLIGRKLADPNPITDKEFDIIIASIKKLNIQLGLTECFEQFIRKYSSITKQQLKTEVIHRKQTPSNIKCDISVETKKKVMLLNEYDYKLYNFIKTLISNETYFDKVEYNIKTSGTFIR